MQPRERIIHNFINMKTISLGEVFGTSWKLFAKRWQVLLLATIIVGLISSVLSWVSSAGSPTTFSESELDFNFGPLYGVISLAQFLLSVFLGIGLLMIMLRVARDQDATLSQLFQGGKYFLRTIFGGILFIIGSAFLSLLLLVPGIYFMLRFHLFSYAIVDKNMGISASFAESTRLTKGVMWQLLLLYVITYGIIILATILAFGTALGGIMSVATGSAGSFSWTNVSGSLIAVVLYGVFAFIYGMYMKVLMTYVYTSLLQQSGSAPVAQPMTSASGPIMPA